MNCCCWFFFVVVVIVFVGGGGSRAKVAVVKLKVRKIILLFQKGCVAK
jgi:hypothetical protein